MVGQQKTYSRTTKNVLVGQQKILLGGQQKDVLGGHQKTVLVGQQKPYHGRTAKIIRIGRTTKNGIGRTTKN